MAGPCRNTSSTRTRSPDRVPAGLQLDLFHRPAAEIVGPPPPPSPNAPREGTWDSLAIDVHSVQVRYIRHDRARRGRLTLRRDGTARCTVPRRGALAEARRFVERCRPWLAKRLAARAAEPVPETVWRIGSRVWFRGEEVMLQPGTTEGRLR